MRVQAKGLSIVALASAIGAQLLLSPVRASAQDVSAPEQTAAAPSQDEPISVDVSLDASDHSSGEPGAVLLGGKIGGIASFNGLDLFVHGGVELGYVFPTLNRGIAALLQVEYSAPTTKGTVDESFARDRVESGSYRWKLLQKELVLQPTFVYRMTSLSPSITPYAGLGLRVYLLESITTGKAGSVVIDETIERSTKWGVGLPLGAEFALGPGALTGEVLLQWGPLQHTLTGDTHLGGLSVFAGYRVLL